MEDRATDEVPRWVVVGVVTIDQDRETRSVSQIKDVNRVKTISLSGGNEEELCNQHSLVYTLGDTTTCRTVLVALGKKVRGICARIYDRSSGNT